MDEARINVETTMYGTLLTLLLIPEDGKFAISLENKIIAEVACVESWKQISGAPLPNDLLKLIYSKIDNL